MLRLGAFPTVRLIGHNDPLQNLGFPCLLLSNWRWKNTTSFYVQSLFSAGDYILKLLKDWIWDSPNIFKPSNAREPRHRSVGIHTHDIFCNQSIESGTNWSGTSSISSNHMMATPNLVPKNWMPLKVIKNRWVRLQIWAIPKACLCVFFFDQFYLDSNMSPYPFCHHLCRLPLRHPGAPYFQWEEITWNRRRQQQRNNKEKRFLKHVKAC